MEEGQWHESCKECQKREEDLFETQTDKLKCQVTMDKGTEADLQDSFRARG